MATKPAYPKALRDRLIQLYGPIPKVGGTVKMRKPVNILIDFGDFKEGDLAEVLEVEPTFEGHCHIGSLRVKWLTNLGGADEEERIEIVYPPEYEVVS